MEYRYGVSNIECIPQAALLACTPVVQKTAALLPAEVWKNIASFLDEDSISSLHLVSHRWYKIAVDARQCTFPKLAHLIKVWSENSIVSCDWEKINEFIRQENHGKHATLTAISNSEFKIRNVLLNALRPLGDGELYALGALAYGCAIPKKFEYLIFQIKYERTSCFLRSVCLWDALYALMEKGTFNYEHIYFYFIDHLQRISQLFAESGNFDVAIEVASNKACFNRYGGNEPLRAIAKDAIPAAKVLICQNVNVDRGVKLFEKMRSFHAFEGQAYLLSCKKLIKLDFVPEALRIANCIDPATYKWPSVQKTLSLKAVSKAFAKQGYIDAAIKIARRIRYEYQQKRALWSVYEYAITLTHCETRGIVLLKLYRALNRSKKFHDYNGDVEALAKQIVTTIANVGQTLIEASLNSAKANLKYALLSEAVEEMCVALAILIEAQF